MAGGKRDDPESQSSQLSWARKSLAKSPDEGEYQVMERGDCSVDGIRSIVAKSFLGLTDAEIWDLW